MTDNDASGSARGKTGRDAGPTSEWIKTAVARYEQPLTLYALRITGDVDLARDAVQETFLRLCSEDRSKVDGHLAEWLFSVCRSRAVDRHRKEKRMAVLAQTPVLASSATESSPQDVVENRESAALVLKALEALPVNQQEVLRLKFQHDLSYREIARVTQLTVTNVGFLIHTGLKTIRQRLQAPDPKLLAHGHS
jgi:RNA polymerase sigma-70 factor (ECF subfamily)